MFYTNEKLFRAAWKNQIRKDGTVSYLAFKDKKGQGTSVQRQYDKKRRKMRNVKDCVSFMEDCGFTDNVLSVTVDAIVDEGIICKEMPTNGNPYHCELYANKMLEPLDDLVCANLSLICIIEKRI